ncbi:ATP-binding protein [Gryllotalpicola protaetiae]|uniref:ATP-binding protein n=1 Tax=Gryllotalpicola protaetiae TaxID=2419771 RepID=A0A387BWZ2_9MICO|nr:ATP-binding protein [Gryllotalpicola protaetiae]
MSFTALHRALGLPPGPLTNDVLDAAVSAQVVETHDLDWKSELPPVSGISQTDVPKDVAAMANSGGGVIIYGVRESQKAATERIDAGEFTEIHERAYRSAAVTAISPPIFGLEIHRLGEDPHAVAVVVPPSIDGPHLIYKNDLFGAPIRNDADTAWMKERQIEAMYRARFDERLHVTQATDSLYAEAAGYHDTSAHALFVAVATPRIPNVSHRLSRDDARRIYRDAQKIALTYSRNVGVHPLEKIEILNPRTGLRRWVADTAPTGEANWQEARASVHHDGSVSLVAAVGGHRKTATEYFGGHEVEARGIECAVADFSALVRAASSVSDLSEYDVRVGIEWSGIGDLRFLENDAQGNAFDSTARALRIFSPVRTTLIASESARDFHGQVYQLAEDCVNQAGISHLHVLDPVPEEE